jgi:UDP-N-acetylglucosamine--N-acetylmuramyl-(pentapeptide) pyrophosphoryl-undecaprenol N-acetylglucosamine transferase
MKNKNVLIMAAGTGGHVFPALAVANELRQRGYSVHWLGTGRGLEANVVPQANIPLHCIDIVGLRSKGVVGWLLSPFRIFKAVWQARKVLQNVQPALVLGFGGFVTGPGGIATVLARIPLLIHEQNALPGLTNRWLARVATRVMCAFPHTFPNKNKAIVTGNPLRAEFMQLNTPERPRVPLRILIVGGSLGALALNETIPTALLQIQKETQLDIDVWHQTGKTHYESMQSVYADAPFSARVSPFIEDMAQAYTWADVAICRAGALTISELAQAGLPAILIPFPHAVDDHQTHNARYLTDCGAAILLQQKQLNVRHLADLLGELCQDRARLQQMSELARISARPEALAAVLSVIAEVEQEM